MNRICLGSTVQLCVFFPLLFLIFTSTTGWFFFSQRRRLKQGEDPRRWRLKRIKKFPFAIISSDGSQLTFKPPPENNNTFNAFPRNSGYRIYFPPPPSSIPSFFFFFVLCFFSLFLLFVCVLRRSTLTIVWVDIKETLQFPWVLSSVHYAILPVDRQQWGVASIFSPPPTVIMFIFNYRFKRPMS